MTNHYSKSSNDKLSTCDPRIIEIMNIVVKIMDNTILCGHRGEAAQNKAYTDGKSNAKYGESEHNKTPSKAVDAAPYPIDWNDKERFARLAGVIEGVARMLGYKIKWGGDFTGFYDGSHFEII